MGPACSAPGPCHPLRSLCGPRVLTSAWAPLPGQLHSNCKWSCLGPLSAQMCPSPRTFLHKVVCYCCGGPRAAGPPCLCAHMGRDHLRPVLQLIPSGCTMPCSRRCSVAVRWLQKPRGGHFQLTVALLQLSTWWTQNEHAPRDHSGVTCLLGWTTP